MLRVGASPLLFVWVASLAATAQQEQPQPKPQQAPPRGWSLLQIRDGLGDGVHSDTYSLTVLLYNPAIREALKLTDEQKTRVKDTQTQFEQSRDRSLNETREAHRKAIAERNNEEIGGLEKERSAVATRLVMEADDTIIRHVLDPSQVFRLQQLRLQAEGPNAFKRPAIRVELGLTPEQITKVDRIIFDNGRQMLTLSRLPPGVDLPRPGTDANSPEAKAFESAARAARYRVFNARKSAMGLIEATLTDVQNVALMNMIGEPFEFLALESGPPYRVLAQDKGKVAIVDPSGKIEWEIPIRHTAHDIQLLPNGNILVPTDNVTIVEMTPDKKVVWKHVSKAKEPYKGAVEIHAFQRLPDGRTMVAETGNKRIIEVDAEDKVVKEIPLVVDKPNSHRDTRRARKLANGHYLVCHELDGTVREYDDAGKVVWSYKLDLAGRPPKGGHDGHGTEVFNAIRKPDGNTIIAGGNNNRVIEVNPEGKIVWSIDHNELPGIELFWVTSLQLRPNGNLIFGNTHAGPDNPQLIEVTRDKKVVWTFHDFKNFGNDLCASQVINVEEGVIR